ncbi:MAG: TIM barrel protein [Candidatus Omnitrophota bacterium]
MNSHLSISTAWNYQENGDMRKMLLEMKALGVRFLELGYQLKKNDLENIISLLDEVNLSVSNLHNFCPVPDDESTNRHYSGYYYLTSLNDNERQKAVQWTKNSIETAVRVKAKVLVIHAGTIEAGQNQSRQLLDMVKDGHGQSENFQRLQKEVLEIRKKNKDPYIQALTQSLSEIMPYAKSKGVVIGLETRYYPMEVPDFEEIGYCLELFRDQGLLYWHDVGHAETNERLGITPHLDFLNQYKSSLVGVHLHGIRGLKDHLAPFDGDFDLTKIMLFFDDPVIKVIEAHPSVSSQQLQEAIKRLSLR